MRRSIVAKRLGIFGIIAVVFAGCGGTGGPGEFPPDEVFLADAIKQGERIYRQHCAACHLPGGEGMRGSFPPLAANNRLTETKTRPIAVTLHGVHGPVEINGVYYNAAMVGLGRVLTDQQIAAALTYARQAWGNAGTPIFPREVAALREHYRERRTMFLADDLETIPATLPGVDLR